MCISIYQSLWHLRIEQAFYSYISCNIIVKNWPWKERQDFGGVRDSHPPPSRQTFQRNEHGNPNLTSTLQWCLTRTEHICHYGLVQHLYDMKQLILALGLDRLGSSNPQRLHNPFRTRHRKTISLSSSSCTRWISITATSRPKTALFFPGSNPHPVH